MKVIANAGPLIALGKLSSVHLLSQLYNIVLVPSAVYDEVVTRGMALQQPDAYVVQLAITRNELTVIDLADEDLPEEVQGTPLGVGEKHVIHLASLEAADLVLLDDEIARKEAHSRGLSVKGTLGILVAAFRTGLISTEEVNLLLDSIQTRPDIWINKELVRRVRDSLIQSS